METDSLRHDVCGFKHQRLIGDQVRLLEVLPQSTAKSIHCRIHQLSLESAPAYTAISYRWGTGTTRKAIQLDSLPFLVPSNAWDAIASQNKYNSSNYLWIDSICIDQGHVTERNHQVSLMTRIYSTAAQVSVWLGRDSPVEDAAFSLLCGQPRSSYAEIIPILDNKYWSRLWVTQELLFAKRIVLFYGYRHARWESLSTLMEEADNDYSSARFTDESSAAATVAMSTARTFDHFRQHLRRTAGEGYLIRSIGLLDLLLFADRLECHDPRDKIYGLVGIYNSRAKKPFLADYKKTTYDLLILAFDFIHRSESLERIDGIGGLYVLLARMLEIHIERDHFQRWLVESLAHVPFTGTFCCILSDGDSVSIPDLRVYVRPMSRIDHVTEIGPALTSDRFADIASRYVGNNLSNFLKSILNHREMLCTAVKSVHLDQVISKIAYNTNDSVEVENRELNESLPLLFADQGRIGQKTRYGVGIACPGAQKDDYICMIGPPHQQPPCFCVVRRIAGRSSIIGKAYHIANRIHTTPKGALYDNPSEMPDILNQKLLPPEFFALLTPPKPALDDYWRDFLSHLYADGRPGSYYLDSEFPYVPVRLGVYPTSVAGTEDSSSVASTPLLSDYSSINNFPIHEDVIGNRSVTPFVVFFGVASSIVLGLGLWIILHY